VSPLKTTSKINELSLIGMKSFFKPNQNSSYSIAGDFHIKTSLSYEELQNHPCLSNWLILNGYSIALSDCQEADMVKIGFLSRVRSIAWREDQKEFIKQTDEWKENPFSFKLYHGTLSLNKKGKMTPLLMVKVARPQLSIGLSYFQEIFDGDRPSSPCGIPYLFFTLYQNQLSEEERESIITDSNFHMGQISLIHLQGILDVDAYVCLWQNITIQVRKILLGLSSPSSNKKLFIQIEKENNPSSIVCAFYTTDSDTIRQTINSLSSYIRQCVMLEDYAKIFVWSDYSLNTQTRSIPIRKGQLQVSSRPVPEEIQQHTNLALSKVNVAPLSAV